MTEDQFTELVARLEREQVANPVRYRRKVILLAAGGYAYIALVLLGSIALLLATLAISRSHYVAAKLTFVVGFFIFLDRPRDVGEVRCARRPRSNRPGRAGTVRHAGAVCSTTFMSPPASTTCF